MLRSKGDTWGAGVEPADYVVEVAAPDEDAERKAVA